MGFSKDSCCVFMLQLLIVVYLVVQCFDVQVQADLNATLVVDASQASGRRIPETLFGIFFEEINHAGAGGLWAELVSNRGFEAGGPNIPSNIDPWSIIGNATYINVETDRTSCFERNKVALRLEVLCDGTCPTDGVGVYNPGFWGMNIEQGKKYKVVFYARSTGPLNLKVSLTGSNGVGSLASTVITGSASDFSNWTKVETVLEAKATNPNSRLQLTTTTKGVIWLDQVSAMPLDTYKGHGFRSDLLQMLVDLKPSFIRFPGGCFVEGDYLRNAFRWKAAVGPWEERPGHFGDVWKYWTDDGLGYYEFLQLSEDLGALPIWVFNNGVSHNDEVDTSAVLPFVQEALDGLEFARGDPTSKWGSMRAAMGHPEPFNLKYVAVGNEDCGKKNYRGNYLRFYDAIRRAYPDIQIISNCDGSSRPLDHPADMYDYHIYTNANDMFSRSTTFNRVTRSGPKAFVSEYAVTGNDAGQGSLLAALAEAGFLIGLEKNSDIVHMASYAPLFVNANDRRWNPDAIVFNSFQLYGTPSYWMQLFFSESNGATLLNSSLQTTASNSLVASAITWQNSVDKKNYIRIKAVNFGTSAVNLKISFNGLDPNSLQSSGSTKTVLTSTNLMDENSFSQPKKVIPIQSLLQSVGKDMNVIVPPHSFTSFDLLKESSNLKMLESDSSSWSSI
ncbi:putative non-reducing end alpha-L-arabinofuranosidase [Medicago truncatula]|uniref:non-reducing end alpha-L-arabinofuranosidase n=2 Tax=Medicago truncatula TaxID=3880 RepID=D7RIC7_MEDTR|nr:alpha-L-arabinofuranosidase 1 [Medicago truncatula]ADH83380.1 alpha-L-arabinofuranosidase [Medicago truncatula]AES81079.1 alpha-L-arabinofuranosidase [Medicago truncatula]RHN47643.1 putative non-reducing end alpha-L-arabinofuranosidase [Medicago truncatula]